MKDIDYDEFLKDTKTSYAVIRCIEIMGEAAKHVPEQIREKLPTNKSGFCLLSRI